MKLNNFKNIHFIGIGGIGVSALAKMMILENKKVSGSDKVANLNTERIKKMGASIFIGHRYSNLSQDTDLIIYSPAISDNNPEIIKAKKLKIPIYSYPQILGIISKEKYTIAISGTHGKTTTTAMIAEILIDNKKSPIVIIGSLLKKQKDNFVMGRSKYFVVEACEYKESFLNLDPDILVITNIDNDHMDYYGNIKNIQKVFAKMINKVPQSGFIICDLNDLNTKKALKMSKRKAKIIDYSKNKLNIKLPIFGEHNVKNAKASLVVAKLLKIKRLSAENSLKEFSGTWRRFEYKGKTKKGALVYDDYAHHPTEIKAVLNGACAQFPNKRIIVIFQPHLYSRTKLLLNDFAKSFNRANDIIITNIYAAREKKEKTIHAKDLIALIDITGNKAKYLSNFKKIIEYLKKNTGKDDLIITIGAGDIYQISEKIII